MSFIVNYVDVIKKLSGLNILEQPRMKYFVSPAYRLSNY